MIEHEPENHEDHINFATELDATFLNEISTAALTKLLIQKDLVSPAEILQQERELRLHDLNHSNVFQNNQRHSFSPLRRLASTRRWSRKLTSILFGWEWKRSAAKKKA